MTKRIRNAPHPTTTSRRTIARIIPDSDCAPLVAAAMFAASAAVIARVPPSARPFARITRLRSDSPQTRCLYLRPLPLWERAASAVQQHRSGEGEATLLTRRSLLRILSSAHPQEERTL